MEMVWDDVKGYGFFPVQAKAADVYDVRYWKRYQAMAHTPVGKALNAFRAQYVCDHAPDAIKLLDVGIGSGAFLELMEVTWPRSHDVFGFDVNPKAVRWLMRRDQYSEPASARHGEWDVMTFWDSLEHIPNPSAVVDRARIVLVSIPIFRDQAHALASKHFRPDEHYWYFTQRGLISWFKRLGFTCVDATTRESELGREDIGTFAFRRTLGCD